MAACVRLDVNERNNSEEAYKAWLYLAPRFFEKPLVWSKDFTMDVARNAFENFDVDFWEITDKDAEETLATSLPGTFILRLEEAHARARIKVSLVLPMDEQRIVERRVQHIYRNPSIKNTLQLTTELRFFRNLRLLLEEYLVPTDSSEPDESGTESDDSEADAEMIGNIKGLSKKLPT